MQYRSVKGFNGFGQLGILFLALGVGMVLAAVVEFIIGMQLVPSGTSLSAMGPAMLKAMKNPQNIQAIRWLQFLSTMMAFFIPALMFSFICNGKNLIWLGFSKYINAIQISIGFLLIFLANICSAPLEELSKMILHGYPSIAIVAKQLESQYMEQVELISRLSGLNDYIIALIMMAFLPALFEEVLFRGALQNLIVKWWKAPLLGILFTALLFSLVHLSIYLFLSRAVLGFVLGLMYYKTKNIWVNIIAHFLNNAIVVTTMYYYAVQHKAIPLNEVDIKLDWWISIFAFGLLIALFKMLQKHSDINVMKIHTKEQTLLVNEPFGNPLA